ncbi:hypothetical protein WN944_013396 [Citrus x changshan-huyou]|uniref:Uncharacterized protein n=1 Tax=Citrus x changshan-huyou TaxID=2935761 RepID=A0AAP0M532_9ROSI
MGPGGGGVPPAASRVWPGQMMPRSQLLSFEQLRKPSIIGLDILIFMYIWINSYSEMCDLDTSKRQPRKKKTSEFLVQSVSRKKELWPREDSRFLLTS